MNRRTHAQRKFAAVTPALAGSSAFFNTPARTTPVSAPPPGPRTHLPSSKENGNAAIIHMNVHQWLDLVSTSRLQRSLRLDQFQITPKEQVDEKILYVVDENTDPAAKSNIIEKPKLLRNLLDLKKERKQPIVRLRKSDVKIAFITPSTTTVKLLPPRTKKDPSIKLFNKFGHRVIRPLTRSKASGRMSLRSRNIRTLISNVPIKYPNKLNASKTPSPPNSKLRDSPKEIIPGRLLRNRTVKRLIIKNKSQFSKVGKTFTRFRPRPLKKLKVLKTPANMSEFSSEDETPLKFFPKNSATSNNARKNSGESSFPYPLLDSSISSADNMEKSNAKRSNPFSANNLGLAPKLGRISTPDVTLNQEGNTYITRKRTLSLVQNEVFGVSNNDETVNMNYSIDGMLSSHDNFPACSLDPTAGCSEWEGMRDVDNKVANDYLLRSVMLDPYVPLPTLRPEDLKFLETKCDYIEASDDCKIIEQTEMAKPEENVITVKAKPNESEVSKLKTSNDKTGEVYEFSTLENDPPPIVGFQGIRRSLNAHAVRSYDSLSEDKNEFLIEENGFNIGIKALDLGTQVECKVIKKDVETEKNPGNFFEMTASTSGALKLSSKTGNATQVSLEKSEPSKFFPTKVITKKCETVTKNISSAEVLDAETGISEQSQSIEEKNSQPVKNKDTQKTSDVLKITHSERKVAEKHASNIKLKAKKNEVPNDAPITIFKSKLRNASALKRKAVENFSLQSKNCDASLEKGPQTKQLKTEVISSPTTRAKTLEKNANSATRNDIKKTSTSKQAILADKMFAAQKGAGPSKRKVSLTSHDKSVYDDNINETTKNEKPETLAGNVKSNIAASSKSPLPRKFKSVNKTFFPKLNKRSRIVEAPVYKPTEEEFQDPLKYIESITPNASQFGLCKIIPPKSVKKSERKFTTNLPKDVKFTANNQYIHRVYQRWGPATKEFCTMRKYASIQGAPFDRPPFFDGVELDLPGLYNVVQKNGGSNVIMENGKWSMVTSQMRLNSNRKVWDNLDTSYVKHLLDYDTCSQKERNQCARDVQEGWKRKYEKMVSRAQNPKRRQHKLLGLIESSDESDTDEYERALTETDECVVRGRCMSVNYFKQISESVYRMHRDYKNPNWHITDQIEATYWNLVLSRRKYLCVYAGAVDSGETLGWPKSGRNQPPWNLKILSDSEHSVLRSLGPVLGLTVPTIHLGMLFSTSCWNRDPHGLPWIEYHHDGANKIWYGIPEEYSDKFKNAVKKLAPGCCFNKTIWLPSDVVMVPPSLLVENGVSISRTVQEPGELIVVFSKAYTSSVCTGYSVSESVYFGPQNWLSGCYREFKEAEDSCEPTMFPLEQLLMSIASDERTSKSVILQTYCILKTIVEEEKVNRKKLQKLIKVQTIEEEDVKSKKRRPTAYASSECDICRASLYMSKVTGLHDKSTALCCKHAVAIARKMLKKKETIPTRVTLLLKFTSKQLDEVMNQLEARIFYCSEKLTILES